MTYTRILYIIYVYIYALHILGVYLAHIHIYGVRKRGWVRNALVLYQVSRARVGAGLFWKTRKQAPLRIRKKPDGFVGGERFTIKVSVATIC